MVEILTTLMKVCEPFVGVKIFPEIVDLSDKNKQLFCPKQDDQVIVKT